MDTICFFSSHEGISLSDLSGLCGAELANPAFGDRQVFAIAPLSRAGGTEVSFAGSRAAAADLRKSVAAAVFVTNKLLDDVPEGVAALVTPAPQLAFALAGAVLVPAATRPVQLTAETGIAATASVDPTAKLEDGVIVEAGAVIGARAEIGAGTLISAGSTIGPGTRIGRNCHVGPAATVQHALIGNNVILHPGVRIGQDGFGYVPGPAGVVKIVQIGRVIIQDHVEIGANTTVDRGAMDDTVIGEGTKIDNLVQIAHNVRIGRYCIIVSQVGIAGSARLGDQVVIGGAAGVNGHLTIGDGAQIAARSGVAGNVPAGARWGGVPARPISAFLRDAAAANARAFGKPGKKTTDTTGDM